MLGRFNRDVKDEFSYMLEHPFPINCSFVTPRFRRDVESGSSNSL